MTNDENCREMRSAIQSRALFGMPCSLAYMKRAQDANCMLTLEEQCALFADLVEGH